MKFLSICVPTYNRNKDLAWLAQQFLVPALDKYSTQIEVLVCDNSDIDIALINKSNLDSRIQYKKNELNLGFAGNLLRCVDEASGTYIWIISDNDTILWSGFEELMNELPQADVNRIDCFMLPIQTCNNFGDTSISNRNSDWQLKPKTNIQEILTAGKVPFILFSSTVIRVNKNNLNELKLKYFDNDYLQVILFFEMLAGDSKVYFLETCTIDYKPEYHARYSIYSISRSMKVVRGFLHAKYGMRLDEKGDYHGWLLWLAHHRGGLYQFKDADDDRWLMLASLPQYLSFKSLTLAFMLILPGGIFRPIYIWYRSFKDMQGHGKLSFREFKQRVETNKKFIAEKLNRSL